MESTQAQVWTLRRMLDWCTSYFEKKQVDPPRLSAEMLLAHVLKCPRIKLYTDLHRPLNEQELDQTRDLVKRAVAQEPIQYLTGIAHFYNLTFDVTRDVLIPRSDTETLVDRVLAHLKHQVPSLDGEGVQKPLEPPRVLELCTGSGCVAAAIAAHHKTVTVVATDISLPALDVARKNIERNKLTERVTFYCGDLYDALNDLVDRRPFDVIVANPPYIATAQIDGLDANVRDYEPRLALDGGADGLDPHRRILAGAYDRLVPGGRVFMEIAFDQEEAALWMMKQDERFDDAKCYKDLSGQPRVITARRPPV